ncbi:hypothetical protein [Bacteroides sp.]|uniref:hypothetical protein n=1 Tax=Bacteroides sp. TaxID=29523 RepID=UPI0025BA171F|nr:hypothetical protein [Bacteroides sp.]
MAIKIYRSYKTIITILLILVLSSCVDETFTNNNAEGIRISIGEVTSRSGTHPGSVPEDYIVHTLRILAFDKVTGNRVINTLYNTSRGNIINQPITPGTYDFVFLANEPPYVPVTNKLNSISTYDNLNEIAYPERFFSSDQIIPMMQEVKNLTILPNQQGAILDNGTSISILELLLNRLGVRVDVLLEAEDNFDTAFNGVIFSKIPDQVPLTANYTGTIERNVVRSFTKSTDETYFSDEVPSTTELKWAKRITRIILPANELETKGDELKAITFTVNMGNNYNPSCKLMIHSNPNDYSLPKNTKLDLRGVIKEPLSVNIVASDWDETNDGWNIADIKILNISSTEVNITDFNGARISFSSNMPIVKVLPKLFIGTGNTTTDTEKIFNDLILLNGDIKDNGSTITYTTSRFSYSYDKATKNGTGYMDVMMDELNVMDKHETYRMILSAEDEDGGKLQREIKVNTNQYGKRFDFITIYGGTGYVGAFFRNNETGERIISGQQKRKDDIANERPEDLNQIRAWRARVEQGDFIVLSTTPSFDQQVGTDNPGDPEKQVVRPNEYKGEVGTYVEGRGRIYFRIGTTGKYTGSSPRYAKIRLERYGGRYGTGDDECWYSTEYLYIRQGETDDYIMRPGTDDPITEGVLKNASRDYARKISPFNLTSPGYLAGGNTSYSSVGYKQGEFVKYPSQAGAFFQWGLPKDEDEEYYRLAYHPTMSSVSNWNNTIKFLNGNVLFLPVWSTNSVNPTPLYDYGYGATFETCPPGYHRPSDGYINKISYNGPYPNSKDQNGNPVIVDAFEQLEYKAMVDYGNDISFSELRQSLYKIPLSGDAGSNSNLGGYNGSAEVGGIKIDRYPNFWTNKDDETEAQKHISFSLGFYADGFYDRRPIKTGAYEGETPYCVASGTVQAAHVGILVYNETYNNASVFFPLAGRRRSVDGYLEYVGQTGYYNTSSIAASSAEDPHSVWSMFLSRWPNPGMMYQLPSFAQSIRCVRDQ